MNDETKIAALSAKASGGAEYDRAAKSLWVRKDILAPLLKAVIPEFQDCTEEEVAGLIVGARALQDEPVDDIPDKFVLEAGTEYTSLQEKILHFDIMLRAVNPVLSKPEKGIKVLLHIDLEFQKSAYPHEIVGGKSVSYPLLKRAIYYACRAIGKQLPEKTKAKVYKNVEKVYSIWIVNDNDPDRGRKTSAATKYTISEEKLFGRSHVRKEDYDLMSVIIIWRGQDDMHSAEKVIRYISSVFRGDIHGIEENSEIHVSQETETEMKEVASMWEADRKIAKREGMREGMEKGMQIQMAKDGKNLRRLTSLISQLAILGDVDTIKKVTAPKPEIDINGLYEKFHIE